MSEFIYGWFENNEHMYSREQFFCDEATKKL